MQIMHVPSVTDIMSTRNPIRPPSMMAKAMPLYSTVVASVVVLTLFVASSIKNESNSKYCISLLLFC